MINYPGRGIGNTTLQKISVLAAEQNKTFWDVLCNVHEAGIKGATLNAIQDFVTAIRHFQSLLDKRNAYEIAFEVGKQSGLIKELSSDKTVEGLARYENIQELLNSIKEYTETPTEDGELLEIEVWVLIYNKLPCSLMPINKKVMKMW